MTLLDRLGVSLPIIQAPMAGVSMKRTLGSCRRADMAE